MYTINKDMKRQIIQSLKALIIALIIPQLIVAQYNEPTYDRKPVTNYEFSADKEELMSFFEVYPKRTDGELNIVMDDFIGQSVEIMIEDETGKTVLHQRIEELHIGFQWLNLNDYNLANGEYKVSVINNGNAYNAQTVFTRKK